MSRGSRQSLGTLQQQLLLTRPTHLCSDSPPPPLSSMEGPQRQAEPASVLARSPCSCPCLLSIFLPFEICPHRASEEQVPSNNCSLPRVFLVPPILGNCRDTVGSLRRRQNSPPLPKPLPARVPNSEEGTGLLVCLLRVRCLQIIAQEESTEVQEWLRPRVLTFGAP